MQLVRPVIAADPRSFGRNPPRALTAAPTDAPGRLADDLRLFGITFLAGFTFVSVFLA